MVSFLSRYTLVRLSFGPCTDLVRSFFGKHPNKVRTRCERKRTESGRRVEGEWKEIRTAAVAGVPTGRPSIPGPPFRFRARRSRPGARSPPLAYPGAGLLAIVRKIIFQWHSELRPLGKKCCAGGLEVMCKCPYLCTTPQGRDGGNATEMRGRTGDTAGGTLPAREAEKGPRKLFQNKFCGFEKSSYLCSPNQGKRRWARRPEPTKMTVQECSKHSTKYSRSAKRRRDKFFK